MRIVSGGQTGADRAALDVALDLGLEVGGWVPRGRWAEDGPVPERYPNLVATGSADPAARTERNVRDADATLVLGHGEPAGGTAHTLEAARSFGRPLLQLDLAASSFDEAARRLAAWLHQHRPATLNVAGPRASEDPRIYDATRRLLLAVLGTTHR